MCNSWRHLVLLCLIGALSACFSFGGEKPIDAERSAHRIEWIRHSGWSAATTLTKWSEARGATSLFVGFVRPEHRVIPPGQRTVPISKFDLEAGKSFSTLLILKSGYSAPYPVLVSVFLDYEQANFSLDGEAGVLHYVNVEPGVDMEIPMEVAVQTPGWHDLFVVVFRDPDNHPTDPQARRPPRLAVLGLRTVVCAGDCSILPQTLPEALNGQKTESQIGSVYAYPLLGEDGRPPLRRLILSADVNAGTTLTMQLWARNSGKIAWDYFVIPLLDYAQTSFAGRKLLHLDMPPGSELFIPGDIRVPRENGVHELQFISIFDPYQALEQVTDRVVESSMRSALVVKDNP